MRTVLVVIALSLPVVANAELMFVKRLHDTTTALSDCGAALRVVRRSSFSRRLLTRLTRVCVSRELAFRFLPFCWPNRVCDRRYRSSSVQMAALRIDRLR
jgi:hypothetical protein